MQIFLSGTDTNIGKTLVASWLCLHSGYKYFKPIQTGSIEGKDSTTVANFIPKENIYKEIYEYKDSVAPYLAAEYNKEVIDFKNIILPKDNNLIIEGAGGLMVPINQKLFMIDLIKFLNLPVILVARSQLGTINHTLLSINKLRDYKIQILGVILSGEVNKSNQEAIMYYGKTKILACLPLLKAINKDILLQINFPEELKNLLITNNNKQ